MDAYAQLEMTRIVIADASAQARAALRLVLEQSAEPSSITETQTCDECLAALAHPPADILLVDWHLPCADVWEFLRIVREVHPGVYVLVLSARPEDLDGALRAGADVFVSKVDAPDKLMSYLTLR